MLISLLEHLQPVSFQRSSQSLGSENPSPSDRVSSVVELCLQRASATQPEKSWRDYSWEKVFFYLETVLSVSGLAAAFFLELHIFFKVVFGAFTIMNGFRLYYNTVEEKTALTTIGASSTQAQQAISGLNKTVSDLETDCARIQKERTQFEQDLKSQKEQFAQLQTLSKTLEATTAAQTEQSQKNAKLLANAQTNIAELEKRLEEHRAANVKLLAEMASLQEAISQFESEAETQQKGAAEAAKATRVLQQTVQHLPGQLSQQVEHMRGVVTNLHRSQKTLISELQATIAALKKENDRLNQTLANLEMTKNDVQKRHHDLQGTLNQKNKIIQQQHKLLEQQREQIEKLDTLSSARSLSLAATQSNRDQLNERVEQAMKMAKSIQDDIQVLMAQKEKHPNLSLLECLRQLRTEKRPVITRLSAVAISIAQQNTFGPTNSPTNTSKSLCSSPSLPPDTKPGHSGHRRTQSTSTLPPPELLALLPLLPPPQPQFSPPPLAPISAALIPQSPSGSPLTSQKGSRPPTAPLWVSTSLAPIHKTGGDSQFSTRSLSNIGPESQPPRLFPASPSSSPPLSSQQSPSQTKRPVIPPLLMPAASPSSGSSQQSSTGGHKVTPFPSARSTIPSDDSSNK